MSERTIESSPTKSPPPDERYRTSLSLFHEGLVQIPKDVSPPNKDNPTKGAASGMIVIHEWADFQCPFCGRVEATIKQILDKYGDKVTFVWHNMPLPFHENAGPAAEASIEVFQQKGSTAFWAFHDALYSDQGHIDDPHLWARCEALGLDVERFQRDRRDPDLQSRVREDVRDALRAGATATPTLFGLDPVP